MKLQSHLLNQGLMPKEVIRRILDGEYRVVDALMMMTPETLTEAYTKVEKPMASMNSMCSPAAMEILKQKETGNGNE